MRENVLAPAGARTRFSRIGVEHANHSTTGSLSSCDEGGCPLQLLHRPVQLLMDCCSLRPTILLLIVFISALYQIETMHNDRVMCHFHL
jgi:hypothetical protein